jgi:REP element-mobilizing transposase RayT
LILSEALKQRASHGGELAKGRRKIARPVALKKPMHLVLRASEARGKYSLLRLEHARFVQITLTSVSRTYGVRVYEFSNVGNHLHLLVRASSRDGFKNFLRVLAGRIAQKVTGARKGKPWGGRFWDLLVFSRIVEWGRAFAIARGYVVKNQLQALGLMPISQSASNARRSRRSSGKALYRRGFSAGRA